MYEKVTREISLMFTRLRKGPIVEIKNKREPILLGGDPVIESFKLDELLAAKAARKRISDTIIRISESKLDQRDLKKWKRWFCFEYTFRGYTKKSSPWAITKGQTLYRLWKIWEGMTDKEMKKINEGISWKKGG